MLERRRLRRLARSRPPTTWEQFEDELIRAEVSPDTAAFVREEFAYAYRQGLTPYAEDRIFSTLEVDPEDLEDAIQLYWEKQGWDLPSRTEPKLVPGDPSLIELAVWLEHRGDVSTSA